MFLLTISFLITIILHEFAHLLVAKKVGCKVLTFSIGFGFPLIKKTFKGTVYQIALLPFGGFCKLQDELTLTRNQDGFANLSYSKKFYIAIAGCVMNIITGLVPAIIGYLFHIYCLFYFGILSVTLGITNLIPLAPCLDGGYIVYLPLCLKIWGKERGYKIFARACKISLWILIILNIACLPYLIYLLRHGGL